MAKLLPPNHQSKSAKSSSICHQNSLRSPNWTAKVTLRNSVCIVYHLPVLIQAVRENFLNERTKCIHPSSICLNVTLHSTNGSRGFHIIRLPGEEFLYSLLELMILNRVDEWVDNRIRTHHVDRETIKLT